MESPNKAPARFLDVAPALEITCWVFVFLAPVLRGINGPAVTNDQFVIQATLISLAVVGGLVLRFYNWHANRGQINPSPQIGQSNHAYGENVRRSFAAVDAALHLPRIARRVVVALLVAHSGLLAFSAYAHSPTLNEPAHLMAGLSHWKFGHFDLYNVNPPLVKMIAAFPVIAAGYKEDWTGFWDRPGARPEMNMGADFVAANGERALLLTMLARWACIPLSGIGAIVCYLWARDLYGRPSGVLACALWCFEPNILAHASLLTPDAHAASLGLAACYTFWRWLKRPTWTQAVLTGAVLGLAELAKTTLIVFYPLWPLMWLAYRLRELRDARSEGRAGLLSGGNRDGHTTADESFVPERPDGDQPVGTDRRHFRAGDLAGRSVPRDPVRVSETLFCRVWLREGGMLVLRILIGLYVLNLGYCFEGSFRPLKAFHFVSELFTGKRSDVPQFGNRFADSWLGELPVPFPKNYLLGIDLQQRDFEHYGRPMYLAGEWRDRGWWYYYLYACAIKVPLGLWTLGVFSVFFRLSSMTGRGHEHAGSPLRDECVVIFPAVVIFAVVSAKTGLNEHMRYVLPTFPFLFIWISRIAAPFGQHDASAQATCLASNSGGRYISAARFWRNVKPCSGVLLAWMILSSLWTYPHSLSYFNELVGGPLSGSKHLMGSNVDWGQDVLYLKSWLDEHPNAKPFYLAYFGYNDPAHMGISFDVPREVVNRETAASLAAGYYGVSKTFVVGYPFLIPEGNGKRKWCPPYAFSGMQHLTLETTIGYSIDIYSAQQRLDDDDH